MRVLKRNVDVIKDLFSGGLKVTVLYYRLKQFHLSEFKYNKCTLNYSESSDLIYEMLGDSVVWLKLIRM